jgi:hypothetical protein
VLLVIAAVRITGRSVAKGVEVGVGAGETEGLGVLLTTFTPLLHTSLEPDLMHVYLIPPETVVDFSLLQVDPALVAAFDEAMKCVRKIDKQIVATR